MVSQDLKYVTADEFSLPKISNATAIDQMAQSMPNVTGYTKKMVETKTFMKDDAKLTKTYDMRLRKTEIQPN